MGQPTAEVVSYLVRAWPVLTPYHVGCTDVPANHVVLYQYLFEPSSTGLSPVTSRHIDPRH